MCHRPSSAFRVRAWVRGYLAGAFDLIGCHAAKMCLPPNTLDSSVTVPCKPLRLALGFTRTVSCITDMRLGVAKCPYTPYRKEKVDI